MLQIDAAALAARLNRETLIDALEKAFRSTAVVPERRHYQIPSANPHQRPGALLIMPAWRVGGGIGIKLATVYPDNSIRGIPAVAATYVLLDAETGQPRALIDGGELTLRRTGAASALASRRLSRADASRLAMIGTGRLAPHLIESHALVRPIREVKIWGRHAQHARSLAASLQRPGWSVEACDDLESAVRWADVVSCATLSTRPLVLGEWLGAGQHLDLVGAFTPDMCEADDAALARSELFVDTRQGALSESGEILGAIRRGVIDEGWVRGELSDLVCGRAGRSGPSAITLFKSVGTALEDLVAAELAVGPQ
ncbi:MAG TPA: ornithine cyclodeaminase family protein [Steroidobacteraceae bacterium]|jgi:ornithine cyclodeaminase|nr:ornithine cyclodeaminase family protein [Steroidobacteraceae bacterium]